MVSFFKDLVERSVFGVCAFIGERFGLSSGRIRMYFIYTSFVALGSPILLYLVMAFWLNIKKFFRSSEVLA